MTAWLPSWTNRKFIYLLAALLCLKSKRSERAALISPASNGHAFKSASQLNLLLSLKFLQVTLFVSVALICLPGIANANNATITNVRLLDQSDSGDTIVIEFDLSWANAWRDQINYDAVWVFAKFFCAGDECHANTPTTSTHVMMASSGTNPTGFDVGTPTAGGGIELVVPKDKTGVFVQPKQIMSGTVTVTDIQLVWDYGASGMTEDADFQDPGAIQFTLFTIEMVYVPEGGFYVGDGTNGANSNKANFEFGSTSSLPPAINSEAGIEFTDATQDGWYLNDGNPDGEAFAAGATFSVSEAYPKGFKAFYMMKYEITQSQYVNFLNMLTRSQQNTRTNSNVSTDIITSYYVMAGFANTIFANRNTIVSPSSGNGTTDPITFLTHPTSSRDERVTGWLRWMDLAAYLDWVALRPFTEFEFEKACRGPVYPVGNEGCWGTTSFTICTTLSGTEDGTETCTTSGANTTRFDGISYTGGDAGVGPIRAGILATSTTDARHQSGSGYYGALNLSDNVYEYVVTVGNSQGISFSGTHGDGTLTSNANATNIDWPGIDVSTEQGVTNANGAGRRGGAYSIAATTYQFKLSNRNKAVSNLTTFSGLRGGRGVRTSPEYEN